VDRYTGKTSSGRQAIMPAVAAVHLQLSFANTSSGNDLLNQKIHLHDLPINFLDLSWVLDKHDNSRRFAQLGNFFIRCSSIFSPKKWLFKVNIL